MFGDSIVDSLRAALTIDSIVSRDIDSLNDSSQSTDAGRLCANVSLADMVEEFILET